MESVFHAQRAGNDDSPSHRPATVKGEYADVDVVAVGSSSFVHSPELDVTSWCKRRMGRVSRKPLLSIQLVKDTVSKLARFYT